MRKPGRSSSALLVSLLFLQAGCTVPVGPPAPIRSDDPEQLQAIRNAREVRTRTRSGHTHWLNDPSVADSQLRGRSTETLPAHQVTIPLDSIVEVQLYKLSPWRTAVASLAGVSAVILFFNAIWDPFS